MIMNEIMDERTATDMAVYFLLKEKSGKMHYKKLMGLMYLSERLYMERCYNLMCGDVFEAKEHGPVLSHTYKLMEGKIISSVEIWEDSSIESPFDIWGSRINKLDSDYISVKELPDDYMEELWLSLDQCETMDEVWKEFGHLSEPELRDYIQNNCLEWQSVRKLKGIRNESKESFPDQITLEYIGEHLGMDQGDVDSVKCNVNPWD